MRFENSGSSPRQIGNKPGLLRTIATLLVGSAMLALGLMFSLVILVVVAVIGVLGFAYFWWKTRALRHHLRQRMADTQQQGQSWESSEEGEIIEGEIIVDESSTKIRGPSLRSPDSSDSH
jgi:uncharacterized protein YacL